MTHGLSSTLFPKETTRKNNSLSVTTRSLSQGPRQNELVSTTGPTQTSLMSPQTPTWIRGLMFYTRPRYPCQAQNGNLKKPRARLRASLSCKVFASGDSASAPGGNRTRGLRFES